MALLQISRQSVSLMTETNEDQRTPGFQRALIGKLIAVGIFVALGTVAVFYSMRACQNCDVVENSDLVAGAENLAEKTAGTASPSGLKLKPVSTGNATLPPVISSSKNGNNRPERFASLAQNTSTRKTAGSDNSFGANQLLPKRVTTQRPPSKSFKPPAQTPDNSFGGNSFTGAAAPLPKKNVLGNAANSVTNRFQQLKNSTTDMAKGAFDSAKSTTNNLADQSGNALRNLSNRAGNLKNNLLGNSATQNANPLPKKNGFAANPNALGPANSIGGSFDKSKTLQPFAAQPVRNPRTNNPLPKGPAAKPITPPIVQSRPLSQSPIRQPIRTPNTPPAAKQARPFAQQTSTPATRMTRSTPGDRKLEGVRSPTITIERIAPAEIQVNAPADFQYIIKNTGRVTASHVRVFDEIPEGTELIQAVPQPSRGTQRQISWDLDSLAPGQEKRIKLQLRPTKPGEIGSIAQVTFSTQASMRTKVTRPMLSIRHATKPRVLIGDPVILDIDIKNDGDGPAKDVVIQEDLPEGLEFSDGFRELEYAIGTLGPGQSKKVSLELKASKIGRYRNTLVAYGNGGLKTQHAVDVEVIAPKLVARGEGPIRRFLKREVTHRFSLDNSGTANATNVELVCKLPSGLKYVSSNNRGQYDENTHSVYWSMAELNAGLVANVELTTVPTEPGNQDLTFEANADLGQTADAICKLSVEHLVDVFFDIDDIIDPIEIGSATAYKLRIVNQGTKTATNIQLSVEFPRGIQPTAVDGNINSEIRGQQIAFSPITSMNPGDEIELTLRGKGISPGDHKVIVNLITDGREVNVTKQESTRVYSDR